MARGGSPTRGVTRVKSKSHEALARSRSNNRQPNRGESKLRALSQSQKNPPSRSRSGSPGRRPPGRSKSSDSLPRRPPGRSNSSDSLARGRKPPNRSSSFGPGDRRPPQRTNSFGNVQDRVPMRGIRRARSMSPSMRGSRASSVGSGPRGSSIDPASRHRSRSRSRSADRFSDEALIRKEYPSQRPRDNRGPRNTIGRSFKRIKQIGGGRGKEMGWGQCCHYVIPLCIILGASVGLLFATGNGNIITNVIDDVIDKFENSEIMDPFVGAKAPHWPRTGNGLEATVINALTPDWQITFDLATVDWSTGNPQAVEIIAIDGDPDPDCEAPEGTIIVCNGDYGDSKWRGVNLADTIGNEIVSTSAQMNEYYLSGMDKGAWQYTMCHEMGRFSCSCIRFVLVSLRQSLMRSFFISHFRFISMHHLGHALGLAHTDESFDNPDLGNCMDYTDNLNANKHPDQSNYDRLVELYGTIGGGRMLRGNGDSNLRTAISPEPSSNVSVPQMYVQHLRKRDPSTQDNKITAPTMPAHIRERRKEAVQKLFQRLKETYVGDDRHNTPVGHTHEDGWQLVHRRHLGEEHEIELGEGYKVRAQFFLVH